jgi:Reverse transcriptase (RNA-dependent DNA polymerase)
MSNREFREIIDDVPAPSGSGNRPDSPPHEGKGKEHADYLVKMVQEGGAGLIKFLLSAAVSSTPAKEKIPDVTKVREWHFRDLMRLPKAVQEEWKIACKEELEALCRHNIFKLTDLPKGRKTIGCRWVFDVKSDGRKKARLVAQGFSQVEGIDFNELFSPVVHFESVQLIIALSAPENYYCVGVDVRNAYLYGKLDEEIYMRQPEGFKVRGQENKVIHLQHALYGLKQAGLAWWKELNSSMNELGFKHLMSDAGLFVCKDFKKIIIAIVYVDYAMFFGKNKAQVNCKKKLFMDKWECRDLGEVKKFLCMRTTRKGKDIYLDQRDYLDKVLERFSMTNAKSAPTPLPSNWVPQLNKGKASPELLRQYQSIIGSLLHLMIGTLPDIAFAVTKLAQFSANPFQKHFE